jgi:hypothetical protein
MELSWSSVLRSTPRIYLLRYSTPILADMTTRSPSVLTISSTASSDAHTSTRSDSVQIISPPTTQRPYPPRKRARSDSVRIISRPTAAQPDSSRKHQITTSSVPNPTRSNSIVEISPKHAKTLGFKVKGVDRFEPGLSAKRRLIRSFRRFSVLMLRPHA